VKNKSSSLTNNNTLSNGPAGSTLTR
jgi:hypothetical protein